jgi:hypothetical protein
MFSFDHMHASMHPCVHVGTKAHANAFMRAHTHFRSKRGCKTSAITRSCSKAGARWRETRQNTPAAATRRTHRVSPRRVGGCRLAYHATGAPRHLRGATTHKVSHATAVFTYTYWHLSSHTPIGTCLHIHLLALVFTYTYWHVVRGCDTVFHTCECTHGHMKKLEESRRHYQG